MFLFFVPVAVRDGEQEREQGDFSAENGAETTNLFFSENSKRESQK